MPFVILCGLPCSGKTRRTEELREHITTSTERTVHVVSDHNCGIDKNDVYSDSRKEKDLRGNLKSEVQRKLSRNEVVILDSANYIKGYRYELYCATKSCQTPHCVIHCDVNPDVATEWNETRDDKDKYTKDIFDGLVMRFEPPESRNRWDSPLFLVQPEDKLPCQEICDALFERKAPPPNMSTLSQPLSSTNFLHELDKLTQSTVNVILEAQKFSVIGDSVSIPGSEDKVALTRHLTLAELQRTRRQFISFTKTHPVDDTRKIVGMFVTFLNNSIH